MALGQGGDTRQFAYEGAAIGDRRQRVFVGQGFQIGDALSRRRDLALEPVDLGDPLHDGRLGGGRQVGVRDFRGGRGIRPVRRVVGPAAAVGIWCIHLGHGSLHRCLAQLSG